MRNAEDNERWLTDGDCTYCRRRTYCKKACSAQKARKESILRMFVRGITGSDAIRKAIASAAGKEVDG